MDTEGSAATGQDAGAAPVITPADRAIGELMAARAISSAITQYSNRLSRLIQITPHQSTAAGLVAAQQAFTIASTSVSRWAAQAARRLEGDDSEELAEMRKRMENALEGLTDLYLDNPESGPEA
jgi:hypothetical protein